MVFGTLNYGQCPYVIYFCCLELFMLLCFYKIDSLEEYSLIFQRALPVLSRNITKENLVFISFLWSRSPQNPV